MDKTTANPDLYFRPLENEELELADALAEVGAAPLPQSESFGLATLPAFKANSEVWGLFIRDTLSGVAWFDRSVAGPLPVRALALPKRRWGLGLSTWVLQQIANLEPDRDMEIALDAGGKELGLALEEAGFTGVDPEAETYPVGIWTRTCDSIASGADAPPSDSPS